MISAPSGNFWHVAHLIAFLAMLMHLVHLSREQSSLKTRLRTFDLNHDKKMGRKELENWAKTTGDDSLFENVKILFRQFDVDGDESLNEAELSEFVDVLDQIPGASPEIKILGGDNLDEVFIDCHNF